MKGNRAPRGLRNRQTEFVGRVNAEGLQLSTVADPPAPATGKAVIYLRFNGAVHELVVMGSDGVRVVMETLAV